MNYTIRPLDFTRQEEVSIASSFSMLTILETIPEVRRQPELISNLDIAQMAQMYENGADNPDHLYLVAQDAASHIVGHAIALMRTDDQGTRHGYSYTRYVLPSHRRQGVARVLLEHALSWWETQRASYVIAHTHATNIGLQHLFASVGFEEVARTQKKWESVELRLVMPSR